MELITQAYPNIIYFNSFFKIIHSFSSYYNLVGKMSTSEQEAASEPVATPRIRGVKQ